MSNNPLDHNPAIAVPNPSWQEQLFVIQQTIEDFKTYAQQTLSPFDALISSMDITIQWQGFDRPSIDNYQKINVTINICFVSATSKLINKFHFAGHKDVDSFGRYPPANESLNDNSFLPAEFLKMLLLLIWDATLGKNIEAYWFKHLQKKQRLQLIKEPIYNSGEQLLGCLGDLLTKIELLQTQFKNLFHQPFQSLLRSIHDGDVQLQDDPNYDEEIDLDSCPYSLHLDIGMGKSQGMQFFPYHNNPPIPWKALEQSDFVKSLLAPYGQALYQAWIIETNCPPQLELATSSLNIDKKKLHRL